MEQQLRVKLMDTKGLAPSVGILTLEPDINACTATILGLLTSDETFDFAVKRQIVKGAVARRVMEVGDLSLSPCFVESAQKLQREGAKVIVGGCGFMSLWQSELTRAVSVPVLTSSLLLVPLISKMLPPHHKVALLTINSNLLSEKHFRGAGWDSHNVPLSIWGVQDTTSWKIWNNQGNWDFTRMGLELVQFASDTVRKAPDTGAFVLECTIMPPFAEAIRKATGLPVFDITNLTRMVFEAVGRP